MFPSKICGLKPYSNFDVFIEMAKEWKSIAGDVNKLNKIIGPLLSLIYSSSVLNQMNSMKQTQIEDEEMSEINFEENQKEIFKKSNFYMFEERKGESPPSGTLKNIERLNKGDIQEISHWNLRRDEEEKKMFLQPQDSLWSDSSVFEDLDSKEENNTIVTVFAATFDDISNCSVNYKELVDFMLGIRDSNLELREEIDNYMEKNDLKPSTEYKDNRVVPDIKEISLLNNKRIKFQHL